MCVTTFLCVCVIGQLFVKRFALCKTVRPMLSDRCPAYLSVCPVCDVGALWPNGWTDQDETWHAGRLRPWPHCVRWGPSSPPPKGHNPQFYAHICCGQMTAWIKTPLGIEVGLGQATLCYMGTPLPLLTKGGTPPPPNFWPMFIVAKRLDASRFHLVWR